MKKIIKFIILTQCVLFALFMVMDNHQIVGLIPSNILKFLSIILCLFITLLNGSRNLNEKDKLLLQHGMIFTVLADLCLLVYNNFLLGLLFFCFVQIIYYIRYKGNLELKESVLLIIFFLIGYKLYSIRMKSDFLVVIGLFYTVLFLSSFIKSIEVYKADQYPTPNKYLITIGMLLFVLCDINVGLFYLAKDSSLLSTLSERLIWIFYLPSQISLALSGYRF